MGETMKQAANTYTVGLGLGALLVAGAPASVAAQTPAAPARPTPPVDRTILPIAPPQYPPITELDARKAKAPSRFEVRPPRGAPNVVIVLIDDMGFGQPSTFGGEKEGDNRFTGRIHKITIEVK
jgi:hypothetical protein